MDLKELSLSVSEGNAEKVKTLVNAGLEEHMDIELIMNEGLISAMDEVGRQFQNEEIYIPEMLIAARAVNAGMEILEPILVEAGVKTVGKAVIGTVKGDLHDIGKNIVGMMLKGAGAEVYDMGVDISAEAFADKAEELGAQIVGLSSLLSTTMPAMKAVIEEFTKRGIRDKYTIMVGGAPITDDYAKDIGADYYAENAAVAAKIAKTVLVS